jgi:hypothetical protein
MPRQPVRVELDAPGVATFTLSVYGASGKLRETVQQAVKVCGGEDCG